VAKDVVFLHPWDAYRAMLEHARRLETELSAAQKRIATLETALRPFADLATPQSLALSDVKVLLKGVAVVDLRRAKEAMEGNV
jgi:hypothetical protein